MRYHYEKPTICLSKYGQKYLCNHPVYYSCALYLIGEKGLAVIQQRYDKTEKTTKWGEIDPWLIDELYLNERFKQFFDERAGYCTDGLYPTVIMWGLKMKPVKRERWETCFDRRII